jgi:hypothetical protein
MGAQAAYGPHERAALLRSGFSLNALAAVPAPLGTDKPGELDHQTTFFSLDFRHSCVARTWQRLHHELRPSE